MFKNILAIAVSLLAIGAIAWPQHGAPGAQPGQGGGGQPGLQVPPSTGWSANAVYDDAAACWNFNDPTDLGLENCIADASLDLTLVNAPTATGGALGYTIQTSTNESAYDSSGVSIGSSGDVSMAGWFVTTTVGSTYSFLGGPIDTWNTDIALVVFRYEDDITLGATADAYVSCAIAGKLTVNTRTYFVAYWDDSEKKVTLTLNDSADTCTSAAGSGALDPAAQFVFGQSPAQNSYPWEGTFGPIVVWDGAVPSAAVQTSLYDSGKGKLIANMTADELVGVTNGWEFSDAAGGPYVDSVGSNDLAGTNTPTRAAGLVSTGSAADDGASDMSVHLNDTLNTYLYHDTWDGIRTESATGITFSFWINQYNSDGTNTVFNQTWHTPSQSIAINAYAADGIGFSYIGANEVNSFAYSGNASTTENAWDLATAWWDPADGKACVQINGETPVCGTDVSTAISGSTRNVDFRIANQSLDADVDNAAIWHSVLTSDERAALWNSGAGEFYAVDWQDFFEGVYYAQLDWGKAFTRLERIPR